MAVADRKISGRDKMGESEVRVKTEKRRESMRRVTKSYVNASERILRAIRNDGKGQTMTEYALILAAVAIVAYVTYHVMGQDIGSMVNKIDTALSSS
jgi:Flp pilus assembly pilin Flp